MNAKPKRAPNRSAEKGVLVVPCTAPLSPKTIAEEGARACLN